MPPIRPHNHPSPSRSTCIPSDSANPVVFMDPSLVTPPDSLFRSSIVRSERSLFAPKSHIHLTLLFLPARHAQVRACFVQQLCFNLSHPISLILVPGPGIAALCVSHPPGAVRACTQLAFLCLPSGFCHTEPAIREWCIAHLTSIVILHWDPFATRHLFAISTRHFYPGPGVS